MSGGVGSAVKTPQRDLARREAIEYRLIELLRRIKVQEMAGPNVIADHRVTRRRRSYLPVPHATVEGPASADRKKVGPLPAVSYASLAPFTTAVLAVMKVPCGSLRATRFQMTTGWPLRHLLIRDGEVRFADAASRVVARHATTRRSASESGARSAGTSALLSLGRRG